MTEEQFTLVRTRKAREVIEACRQEYGKYYLSPFFAGFCVLGPSRYVLVFTSYGDKVGLAHISEHGFLITRRAIAPFYLVDLVHKAIF